MGSDFVGNPLGNPFAPMSSAGFPNPGYGRGYGWNGPGSSSRGRGLTGKEYCAPQGRGGQGRGLRGRGRRPPTRHGVDLGEILMPEEGEEGNAAYSGKLGKRGQVRIFSESCSIPFMPLTFQLTDYIIQSAVTKSAISSVYSFSPHRQHALLMVTCSQDQK